MKKHILEDHKHEQNIVNFKMKVRGTFKTPFSRIINEGIRIKNIPQTNLLNSKNEHFGPSIMRKNTASQGPASKNN